MSGIFISYREDDAQQWPLVLRNHLASAYGKDFVFLDKGTLEAGEWWQQIEAALERSTVVLVLIGRQWLDARDSAGRPALSKPDDFHRREIEIALAGPATVIPVLLSGASMPENRDLPESIATLSDFQARPLSDTHSDMDLETLLKDVDRADPFLAERRPPPRPPRSILRLLLTILLLVVATFPATVALVVTARIGFGWTFRSEQISTLAVIILIMLIAVWRLRMRHRQTSRYDKA